MNRHKFVFIGGGSFQWMPRLAMDLFMTESLAGSRLVLVDVDQEALAIMQRYCRMRADQLKADWSIEIAELDDALDGATSVCACISTGGLEAMHHDYTIPEQFGVYHSVGDTVGPGGISRTLRNVPVFVDIAKRMERYCPTAWLIHVTNPLAQLTSCVWQTTSIRCVGLCHIYDSTVTFLAAFLGCDPKNIHATSVGVNHFSWLKNLKCQGNDISDQLTVKNYLAYEERTHGIHAPTGTIDDDVAAITGENKTPRFLLSFELFERYGIFPVGPSSHLSEGLPYYINSPKTLTQHGIWRKGVFPRRAEGRLKTKNMLVDRLEGRQPLPPPQRSSEGVVTVMEALCTGKPAYLTVNLPNRGQIPNLPLGAVVETGGVVMRDTIEPVFAGEVPTPVAGLVQTIAQEEQLAVEAALTGDRKKVIQAIALSPAMYQKDRAEALADALLAANAQWLGQFHL